ncbi:hypothetical protein VT84_29625 [Gemmata sp. SH-PL17]|uniref:hypothetical protein n=1 Tax=Gemmata sp. SH-PL17 TaxID=1630693 RepID=UPI0004B805B0|nr:hypothetical protein [Gemmata sp. SH-PL17]AMV28601.1 hypothetical protein VT84_29625 [Gemmata sp. SH-PL17]
MAVAKLCLVLMVSIWDAVPKQDGMIEAAVLKLFDLKHTPPALREFITAKTPVAITEERFAPLGSGARASPVRAVWFGRRSVPGALSTCSFRPTV